MPGNALRSLIGRLESAIAVRRIRQHDASNLFGRHPEIGRADPIARPHQRDWFAIRGWLLAVVNVVHPLERLRLPGVHLEDDLIRAIDPRLVIADQRTRHDSSVFEDAVTSISAHRACPGIHTPRTG